MVSSTNKKVVDQVLCMHGGLCHNKTVPFLYTNLIQQSVATNTVYRMIVTIVIITDVITCHTNVISVAEIMLTVWSNITRKIEMKCINYKWLYVLLKYMKERYI